VIKKIDTNITKLITIINNKDYKKDFSLANPLVAQNVADQRQVQTNLGQARISPPSNPITLIQDLVNPLVNSVVGKGCTYDIRKLMSRERMFKVSEDRLKDCVPITTWRPVIPPKVNLQNQQLFHNQGHNQYEDNDEPDLMMFRVYVYRTGRNGDDLLASSTANRSQTIKSVLDAVKGANPSQRCIVSSGKQFVTSLDPKDYYTTFANLRLRYPQAELTLI
jgi:hypothetical protein